MHVVILGCGRVGARLATVLSKEWNTVYIVDKDSNAFRRLGPEFRGQAILGTGIDHADIFVAVTNGDNTNIMTAQVAKEIFKVRRVVARIYDPERARTYRDLGLEVICSTIVISDMIRDSLLVKV